MRKQTNIAAPITPPQFVDEKVLESITGIRARTWQKHRLFNRGPRFYRIHGAVRYRLDEVLTWIESHAAGGEVAEPLTPPASTIR